VRIGAETGRTEALEEVLAGPWKAAFLPAA
jgi:hypothetical protein